MGNNGLSMIRLIENGFAEKANQIRDRTNYLTKSKYYLKNMIFGRYRYLNIRI